MRLHVHEISICQKLACITFPTKKLPDFLQQQVATEGIWLQFSITLNLPQYTVS